MACQVGLFLDFAESSLPCLFAILDCARDLAPFPVQGVVPAKKQNLRLAIGDAQKHYGNCETT